MERAGDFTGMVNDFLGRQVDQGMDSSQRARFLVSGVMSALVSILGCVSRLSAEASSLHTAEKPPPTSPRLGLRRKSSPAFLLLGTAPSEVLRSVSSGNIF